MTTLERDDSKKIDVGDEISLLEAKTALEDSRRASRESAYAFYTKIGVLGSLVTLCVLIVGASMNRRLQDDVIRVIENTTIGLVSGFSGIVVGSSMSSGSKRGEDRGVHQELPNVKEINNVEGRS